MIRRECFGVVMYNPCRDAALIVRELAYELPDAVIRPGSFPSSIAVGCLRADAERRGASDGPTQQWGSLEAIQAPRGTGETDRFERRFRSPKSVRSEIYAYWCSVRNQDPRRARRARAGCLRRSGAPRP